MSVVYGTAQSSQFAILLCLSGHIPCVTSARTSASPLLAFRVIHICNLAVKCETRRCVGPQADQLLLLAGNGSMRGQS